MLSIAAMMTQPPAEQRRLLKTLVEKAAWKDGELETTLRNPFQKLRLSNRASTTKQGKNGTGGTEMKNWLPRQDSNLRPFGVYAEGFGDRQRNGRNRTESSPNSHPPTARSAAC